MADSPATAPRLRDVIALLVTPFHRDFSLNEAALRDQIAWAIAEGARGVVAAPSIGEFLHLTEAERRRVFEITLDHASRYRDIAVVAMTSGPDTLSAIRWTDLARQMGFDAAMVVPPFYWPCGPEEAFEHYRLVAEACDIPLVVYHNPALSKFRMTPEFIGRVAELARVVAVKEVETDLEHLEALVEALRGKAAYLQTFRAYYTARLLGSAGGFVNIFAVPACVAIDRALARGEPARALEIQMHLNRCFPRGGEGSLGRLGATKLAATLVTGIDMGPPRPPYRTPEQARALLDARLPALKAALRP
jgi:dihydrodipicolinate synthase/N-acetylneuraminate lyase